MRPQIGKGWRWTCIDDPEGVMVGRSLGSDMEFRKTLELGNFPPGSVWARGSVVVRVVGNEGESEPLVAQQMVRLLGVSAARRASQG